MNLTYTFINNTPHAINLSFSYPGNLVPTGGILQQQMIPGSQWSVSYAPLDGWPASESS
jgi:hypothetical protein